MVYTLFSLMFKVFFVAAAAYLLRRRGALTAQDQKSVTNVLMRFVVYFTVIMSSQQDFSLKAAKAILVTAIYAVLFFAVFIPASIFLSRRLKLEEAKRRIFVCSLVFCNITFIGYPILQELYGNIGLLCAIVFSMIYNVVFYSWGDVLFGRPGAREPPLHSDQQDRPGVCAGAGHVLPADQDPGAPVQHLQRDRSADDAAVHDHRRVQSGGLRDL